MVTTRISEINVKWVPLSELKAYDGNAKKHDHANIDAIANSISEFGFRNPILAWHNEDGIAEIVAGHGRAAAAKKLMMEKVPVVFVDDLSDAQRRMLTHADNQTNLMTGFDQNELQYELETLSEVFNISDFGFAAMSEAAEPDPVEMENKPFGKIAVLAMFNARDAAVAKKLEQKAKELKAEVTMGGVGYEG